jgi:hypothetical protein
MSITLTPFVAGVLCRGASWTVPDEAVLAEQIARVAIGQSLHVERILSGARLKAPPTVETAKIGAIELLTANDPERPWHRDGWMFQVMSWIAAHRATPGGLIQAPHMIPAHKGFDGLQLELDAAGQSVTAAVLFEDKATDNPRDTIRDEVWPELRELESGDRDNLVIAEVVTLLGRKPALDPFAAIQDVIWKSAKRYRVSVTVGPIHEDSDGRLRLFHDYDQMATGDLDRRLGGTFPVADLRPWMANLAAQAIERIQGMGAENV